MIGAVIVLGLIILVAALLGLLIFAVKRKDEIKFAVIGVTNERRTVEQLCALQAAHQGKADAQLEARYDEAVRMNRFRRSLKSSRIRLIINDPEAAADPFRRQAD